MLHSFDLCFESPDNITSVNAAIFSCDTRLLSFTVKSKINVQISRPPANTLQMADGNDMDLTRAYADQNSEPAFAELVDRHINLVYSVALRQTRQPQDAQDITQAVFILLARKAAGLRQRTTLTGWLYETTRFTSRQLLRTRARRQAREQEAYMQSTLSEMSEADSVWRQLAPLLEDAMTRLSEKERTLLALRFFENKTGAETAALLGLRESAAHKRSARALEKLRKFFAQRGIISTPALIAAALSAHSVQAAPTALAPTVTALAFTKGAAGGASTLTLVKGALKLMAWTKLKTAALTAAVVLLAALGTSAVLNHARHTPPRQTGRMTLPTGPITPMVHYAYSHYVMILAGDGSLWTWGEESLGWPVFGLTDTTIHAIPSLRRVGQDSDWTAISAGEAHCLAIKSDGSLWAWGENLHYQLGDGTKTTRAKPVSSAPGHDWKQASAGGDFSLAIKTDGTLWAWGNNWSGQLGIPGPQAKNNVTHATQVGTSTNWAKIWSGDIQTVGLQNDGSLWFWGSLTGDASVRDSRIPRRISPDTNWVDVSLGYFTVFAIKSDGTLWSWGREANVYTGATDPAALATPHQVGNDTDWQSSASSPGGFYTVLMKKDGSLWAMDASDHRTVKPDPQYQPVKFQKMPLRQDIAAYAGGGDGFGVILTRDGEVWTWGSVLGEKATSKPLHSDSPRVIPTPWQVANQE
jgi:RNA polymerase sigma factor (sigma-70 family)